jgi:hypothetical protein
MNSALFDYKEAVSSPSLSLAVTHIVCTSAQKEVTWIDTAAIVAGVANL